MLRLVQSKRAQCCVGSSLFRTAGRLATSSASAQRREEFVSKFGANPCVVPLPDAVNAFTADNTEAARSVAYASLLEDEKAFAVSGNYVALAPSRYHEGHWRVQQAMATVPDDGILVTEATGALKEIIAEKSEGDELASWCAEWNDVVELTPDGKIVPVNRHGNAFVRALRRVIYNAPLQGITVEELVTRLQGILGVEDTDPELHGFSQLGEALLEAADIHYTAATPAEEGEEEGEAKIYPADWGHCIFKVFQSMPTEGLLEKTIMKRVQEELPDFVQLKGSFTGADNLADFIQTQFPHLLSVKPSLTDASVLIYRRALWATRVHPGLEPVTGWGGFERDVTAALEAFESNPDSGVSLTQTIVTDHGSLKQTARRAVLSGISFDAVLPLLPTTDLGSAAYGAPSWDLLLEKSSIALECDFRLTVRERASPAVGYFFVDGTAVNKEGVQDLCRKYNLGELAADATRTAFVIRRGTDGSHNPSDELLSPWLEPEHVVVSKVSEFVSERELSSSSATTLCVFCAEEKRETFVSALEDSSLVKVSVEPSNDECREKKMLKLAVVSDSVIQWMQPQSA